MTGEDLTSLELQGEIDKSNNAGKQAYLYCHKEGARLPLPQHQDKGVLPVISGKEIPLSGKSLPIIAAELGHALAAIGRVTEAGVWHQFNPSDINLVMMYCELWKYRRIVDIPSDRVNQGDARGRSPFFRDYAKGSRSIKDLMAVVKSYTAGIEASHEERLKQNPADVNLYDRVVQIILLDSLGRDEDLTKILESLPRGQKGVIEEQLAKLGFEVNDSSLVENPEKVSPEVL